MMRCHISEQLKSYFAGKLSPTASAELEQHVEQCAFCQKELDKIMEGTPVLDEFLAEELLSPDFTQKVLEEIVVQTKVRTRKKGWKKRGIDIMRKTAIAVASLAAAIAFGTMVSPTFANYVNSLFHSVKGVDGGMKNAADEGYVQTINKQVTDKGITVSVKEVLADPIRLMIIWEVTDQNGKKMKLDDVEWLFKLTDKKGKGINPDSKHPDYIPFSSMPWGDNKEYFQSQVDFKEMFVNLDDIPDELNVKMEYSTINNTVGPWTLEFPVDMKKAKAVSKTVKINQEYTSPQGVIIRLNDIVTVPSASVLTHEAEWNEQKVKEYQKVLEKTEIKKVRFETRIVNGVESIEQIEVDLAEEMLKKFGIAYEIIDEKGNTVAGYDELYDQKWNNIVKSQVEQTMMGIQRDGETNKSVMWQGYAPFSSHEKLRFRLHSIYLMEPANFIAKLNFAKAGKQPITVENSGSTFTFSDFRLKTSDQEEEIDGKSWRGKGAIINVKGTLPQNMVNAIGWKATDETGKEYSVYVETGFDYIKNGNGQREVNGAIFVSGLEKHPKELTISYKLHERQHRDVNWEVPFDVSKQK
ncbi:DUF4179 domain-containing protein [uncultured Brevibacillus sp.]|uniref:DUF4179 domain-containing protein n=1 Tax=uncultured Brevibacillus sp. TaxID=169970 RepID=UPI002594592F|nr:DUF4179 domain-containing protein [uncultured Brevibacillus sp.]